MFGLSKESKKQWNKEFDRERISGERAWDKQAPTPMLCGVIGSRVKGEENGNQDQ